MNAPLAVNVKDIDTFSELLSEDFIKETVARSEQIASSREQSLQALRQIEKNYEAAGEKIDDVFSAFKDSSGIFARLQKVCRDAEKNMAKLQRSATELSENLHRQAQLIQAHLLP